MNLKETEEDILRGFRILRFFQHVTSITIAVHLSCLLLGSYVWNRTDEHRIFIFTFICNVLVVFGIIWIYKRLERGAMKTLSLSSKKELYKKMNEYLK